MNELLQPEAEVLLATFNGARFLREQIDSILSQTYAPLRIVVSDDGSSDETPAILAEYASRLPDRFRVLPSRRPTGHPKWNFLRLMQASTAPYVCFADQDDVWLPDKISATMRAMRELERVQPAGTPLLVFTDLRVVDAQLRTLHESYWARNRLRVSNIHRLARVLGENPATGCTMMLNRALCELAREMPVEAEMHDRWAALLAASLGAAAYVSEPTMLYRQHDRNVIGSAALDESLEGLAVRALSDSSRRRERLKSERQAEALLRLHGAAMSEEKRKLLESYLESGRSESSLRRVGLTLRYGFFRSGLLRSAATIADLWRARSSD
ncbi:Glycosyl transferase family 2 [Granulicella rosea]|uniref:Glycosyl transferase family 2 n=1 Tax=Granulicella rosea TaxID=474952 RepID=A0A239LBQ0_9BACT|nr:glycosyltransferase family 2 protein [Granulicella rosea]SNT27901.1 Glycosyl transferase family 2 [Granulicella rosea]